MADPQPTLIHKIWRRHVRPIAIVVLVLTSFRSAIADWNDVPTGSMKPSIIEGDRIFVNKVAYGLKVPFTTWHLARWDAPKRGEVVVFNSPADGTRLVKRVVGLPGDIVEMVGERLYINGKPLQYEVEDGRLIESLGQHRHAVQFIPGVAAMRDFGPFTIPAGEYFMLGDNRDNSADSRYFGTVRLDQILGRSSRVVISFDYNRFYLPRWGRLLEPLDEK
jgi:signal peptidase I